MPIASGKHKPLSILVIADCPDDVELLEEVFIEIDEVRFSRDWLRPVERVYSVDPGEAFATATSHFFDAALLDLNLGGGCEALALFHRLREKVPRLPILVLAGIDEEALAISLVRQGAQDCVLKAELDCIPFARMLSCAVGRQRIDDGRRSQSLVDEFTGMWNERGFALVAQSHLGLAAQCGLAVLVASAELPLKSNHVEDLDVLEAAEAFRAVLPESALTARLGGTRFAAMVVAIDQAGTGKARSTLAGRMEVHWTTLCPQVGLDTSMAGALQALCENVGVAPRAGRHL